MPASYVNWRAVGRLGGLEVLARRAVHEGLLIDCYDADPMDFVPQGNAPFPTKHIYPQFKEGRLSAADTRFKNVTGTARGAAVSVRGSPMLVWNSFGHDWNVHAGDFSIIWDQNGIFNAGEIWSYHQGMVEGGLVPAPTKEEMSVMLKSLTAIHSKLASLVLPD